MTTTKPTTEKMTSNGFNNFIANYEKFLIKEQHAIENGESIVAGIACVDSVSAKRKLWKAIQAHGEDCKREGEEEMLKKCKAVYDKVDPWGHEEVIRDELEKLNPELK